MPLSPGSRLGAYQIISPLGAGGMGEVYRAHDSRLGRDVAIKILPQAFVNDAERLSRFEREARMLASINHPNIAAIYGVEDIDGVRALVLELVEGEDLTSRLHPATKFRVDEVIAIAGQIADALDAAHERGIVHRDLKPGNIRVTADDVVKVLDFGIAKPAANGSSANLTHSPTTLGPTVEGTLLGTAPYMSPEQARGKTVDKRTDIWAFGCVVYEMLTGKRAFSGETTSDVIAAILERSPDWSALPRETPPGVRALLERCLEKDPKRRLRDIADAAPYFDRTATPPAAAGGVPWILVVTAAVIFAMLGGLATAYVLRGTTSPANQSPGGAMTFSLPPIGTPALAISADGSTLAWTVPSKDGVRLVTRRLNQQNVTELPGTESAAFPFLAPDGHAIGFFSNGLLKKVDVASGAVQTVSRSAAVSLGGTWSIDDQILFSDRFGLHVVPASGGEPKLVVPLNKEFHENSLRHPQFLPDGRHFVYVARSGRPEESSAYLGSLDSPPKRLFATLGKVMFAPPNYLLFMKEQTLLAQRFDVGTATLSGEAVTLATDVFIQTTGLNAAYSVSDNGVLVYAASRPIPLGTLHWFDRSGRDLGAFEQPRPFAQYRLSPDGRRVAAALNDDAHGSRSIWILEPGHPPTRLTFVETHDWEPAWSGDGRRIAFTSYRNGPLDLYIKDADGATADKPLVLSNNQKDIGDLSPDGRYVVYREVRDQALGDIVVADTAEPNKTIEISGTPQSDEFTPRFSADGKWIAYVSFETGRGEVVVQPFPPTGAKWQVSVDGGDAPAWRGDGREMYFVDRSGMLQAVTVGPGPTPFASSHSTPLFQTRATPGGAVAGVQFGTLFDAARDGQRFLIAIPEPTPPVKPASVVLNWTALMKAR